MEVQNIYEYKLRETTRISAQLMLMLMMNSDFQALSGALVLRLHEKRPLYVQLDSLFCVVGLPLRLVQLLLNGRHGLGMEQLGALLLHEQGEHLLSPQ